MGNLRSRDVKCWVVESATLRDLMRGNERLQFCPQCGVIATDFCNVSRTILGGKANCISKRIFDLMPSLGGHRRLWTGTFRHGPPPLSMPLLHAAIVAVARRAPLASLA